MPPLLLALALTAAAPREELMRFVPDDAGICVVVTDLGAQAAALGESPFVKQLLRSPLARGLGAAKEWDELDKVEKYLAKTLGVEMKELAGVIPGEAAAFAYRPGPAGKPEGESGLFLLRAKDEKALSRVIDKLHAAQKESGELVRLEPREHKGVGYVRRVEKKESNFYLLRGPVVVFSAQEEMLKKAIERDAADGVGLFGKRLAALPEKGFVHAIVNPRAFDGQFAEKDAVGAYWKALDGIDATLAAGRELRLTVGVNGVPARLPPAGRRLFASEPVASVAVPEGTQCAVGGRVDVAGVWAAAGDFLPAEARSAAERSLQRSVGAMLGGKSVVKEVMPALGPDWGLYAVAPPAESKEVYPRVVLALKVAGGGEDPVDEAVLGALHVWANMAVLSYNTLNPDAVALYVKGRVVEGLPAGMRPSYGLRAGFLVVATHPDEVGRFKPSKADGKAVLLRASFGGWRDYLGARREALAEALARREGVKKEVALERIDAARTVFGLLDKVELTHEAAAGRATFTLRLRTVDELR